jgi:TonB family protein
MEPGLNLVESAVNGESPVAAPTLLVELPAWHQVFFRNLADAVWSRSQPPLRLASKPDVFWSDVFVASPAPWNRFLQSAVCHVAVVVLIFTVARFWPARPQIAERPVFDHNDIIYYSAADYLPPLETGRTSAPRARKGEPAFAPQPIISVPPEADNPSQTIVAPPNLKLNHDVPMPNVVAWPKTPLAVPIALTEHSLANAKAPDLNVPVVAPPPEVQSAASRRVLHSLQPAAVAPSPEVNTNFTRRLGDINIGHAQVVAPAPQLPVAEQRTADSRAGLNNSGLGNSGPAVVPPPPSVRGSGVSSSGGRLIALGIHPMPPSGPVEAPGGNRRGSFAATPQGKPGASGTPDVAGGGNQSAAAAGSGNRTDIPSGLHVGGPSTSNHIGGAGSGSGTGGAQSDKPVEMAKVTPPRVTGTSPRGATEMSSNRATDAEKEIFGDRKFYGMTLSVPNLNSSGGSWVIHFAELHVSADAPNQGELVAPAAVAEADPAYPLELMKQNIEGKVTLYAVIRSDGSVSDVRVLRSVDDRLDQYACDALARWHFRPATKNGSAVDLEAVVTIPFRPSRSRSNF